MSCIPETILLEDVNTVPISLIQSVGRFLNLIDCKSTWWHSCCAGKLQLDHRFLALRMQVTYIYRWKPWSPTGPPHTARYSLFIQQIDKRIIYSNDWVLSARLLIWRLKMELIRHHLLVNATWQGIEGRHTWNRWSLEFRVERLPGLLLNLQPPSQASAIHVEPLLAGPGQSFIYLIYCDELGLYCYDRLSEHVTIIRICVMEAHAAVVT